MVCASGQDTTWKYRWGGVPGKSTRGGVPEADLTRQSEVWLTPIELWSALWLSWRSLAGERMFWASLLKAEEVKARNESI